MTNGQTAADTVLHRAIHDAEQLICYASASGIELSPDVAKIIIESKVLADKKSNDAQTFDQQIKFWAAYNTLAKNVSPVSAASLETSTRRMRDHSIRAKLRDRIFGRPPDDVTAPEMAVRSFRRWTIATLILLLSIQIYWVVGKTVVDEINPLIAEAQSVADQTQPKLAADELQRLEAKQMRLDKEMELRLNILDGWNAVWKGDIFTHFFRSKEDRGEEDVTNAYESLRTATLQAQFVLSAIQLYALPLLYGLLGACLYVLRNLGRDVKALTYTRDLSLQYRLRLYMGLLAGLVIVWFIPSTKEIAQLQSLTPFAIALLAGYSVELLFAFFDKLIAAFTTK